MVDFETSMSVSKLYREKNESEKWMLLKTLYENSLKNKDGNTKIPKKIHQIWLGGDIPSELKILSDLWYKLCCENNWEYYLWNDNNIHDLTNETFFLTHNLGQKSDILRYNILKKYGGIYMDLDFVPVKMFDDFILENNFFCGIAYELNPILYNGLIGSISNGELITDLCDIESVKSSNPEEIMDTTGPYYLTRKFFNNTEGSVAYPLTYFYPFSNSHLDRNKGNEYKNYKYDETYCIHLWKCSWM